MIKECRPISKKKYFKVTEILEKVEHFKDPKTGITVYPGKK